MKKEITKNYGGIIFTFIAAKVYNDLLLNCIKPLIVKILGKNQDGFRRNRYTTSQILTIHRIIEEVRAKNLEATLMFVDFSKAFDSIHKMKVEQILLPYSILKETVITLMMLAKNTKSMVCSTDGVTDLFDIVDEVLQEDILALCLFIISVDYVLRISIDLIRENGFTLGKARSKRYPSETIRDADYVDDLELFANTPAQA